MVEKLAINGGIPIRKVPIYYGHQCIDEDDVNAVVQVLKSDCLTCGPEIARLEKRLCEVTGAKWNCCASCGLLCCQYRKWG